MLRQMFSKPKELNQFMTRQVDPMELFWDLIFVVTLRYIIDSYVSDFTMYAFLIGLLVFVHAFIVWTNISIYSVNFYDVSHNNRLIMTLMLAPLLIIASITDYSLVQSEYYLGISIGLIKLIQALIWKRAIDIHKTDNTYKSLNSLYRTEVVIYIICAAIAFSLLIIPNQIIPVLLILIILELFVPSLINKKKNNEYAFDRILIAERFLLFIILIFGEGFIGIVHIFQHGDRIDFWTLYRGILLFITIYAMFLKLYDEYTIHKERISTTFMIYLNSYVIASMLLISGLTVLGLWYDTVDLSVRAVMLLGVITYHMTYGYNSYRYLQKRKEHLLACDIVYYKKDLYKSLIILVLSIIVILFISSPVILLTIIVALIVYSSCHIKVRETIVADIFEHDHEIAKQ